MFEMRHLQAPAAVILVTSQISYPPDPCNAATGPSPPEKARWGRKDSRRKQGNLGL